MVVVSVVAVPTRGATSLPASCGSAGVVHVRSDPRGTTQNSSSQQPWKLVSSTQTRSV